jgi:hypothetical protein
MNTITTTAKVTARAIPSPHGDATVTIDGTTYRVYRANIRVAYQGDDWDHVAYGEGNWFHPDNIAESLRWTSGKALPADFGARVLAALDRSVQRYQAAGLAK